MVWLIERRIVLTSEYESLQGAEFDYANDVVVIVRTGTLYGEGGDGAYVVSLGDIDTPDGESIDEQTFIDELRRIYTSAEGVPEPYVLDISKRSVNWGASGAIVSIVLSLAGKITDVSLGALATSVLGSLRSRYGTGDGYIDREKAQREAEWALLRQYSQLERSSLTLAAESEHKNPHGWTFRFEAVGNDTYYADAYSNGVCRVSRNPDFFMART